MKGASILAVRASKIDDKCDAISGQIHVVRLS